MPGGMLEAVVEGGTAGCCGVPLEAAVEGWASGWGVNLTLTEGQALGGRAGVIIGFLRPPA